LARRVLDAGLVFDEPKRGAISRLAGDVDVAAQEFAL
jgi:hypothetical protein